MYQCQESRHSTHSSTTSTLPTSSDRLLVQRPLQQRNRLGVCLRRDLDLCRDHLALALEGRAFLGRRMVVARQCALACGLEAEHLPQPVAHLHR